MAYPAVARSLKAFVCRVALYYMARGYHLYAMGYVPERAEPEAIDRKLIEKYGIDITARKRAYRKTKRQANVHYLRFGRLYLLLATPGTHKNFFNGLYGRDGRLLPDHLRGEMAILKDAAKTPIVVGDYSITATPAGVSVRIRREVYRVLKAYFRELATTRRDPRELEAAFKRECDYLMFRPIQRQLKTIVFEMNTRRKRARLEPVPIGWRAWKPAPVREQLAA
jgi:hypothetical protein